MTSPDGTSIDQLAQDCQQQTDLFRQGRKPNNRFCFELLRLTFSEGAERGYFHIYQIYGRQVYAWIANDSRFPATGEECGYFANWAMARFFKTLANPVKFSGFSTLQEILAYLRVIAYNTITQHLRDHPMHAEEPIDGIEIPVEPNMEANLEGEELLNHIYASLGDDRDREIAYFWLVLGMKPREIVTDYGDRWAIEQVAAAKQRIWRCLRQDPLLRERYGLDSEA